ncbi:MAG: 3'-5' exonuclease [Deltaproteobacteria bacterium]|nr:3'-5' exonuclease [Deltaproteobacteria bacterium]
MFGFFKTGNLQKLYARHTGRKDMPPALGRQLEVRGAYQPEALIAKTSFVIFDTETTGLHLEKGDRLLSIGAVKIAKARVHLGNAFYELIDPERPIPPSSIFVHNITPGVATARPHVSEILLKFLKFVDTAVLVAHHAGFDMKFLNHAMVGCFGFPIQNRILDTALAAAWIRGMEETELILSKDAHDTRFDAVAAHFGITAQDRHSAFGDALSTALLFQRFINILNNNGIMSLRQLVRIAGVS